MNACAPGTHYNTLNAERRYRCVWCGTTHVPTPDTRPRCPRCQGIGVQALVWHGPGATLDYWLPETCTECAGTGRLSETAAGAGT